MSYLKFSLGGNLLLTKLICATVFKSIITKGHGLRNSAITCVTKIFYNAIQSIAENHCIIRYVQFKLKGYLKMSSE